MPASTVPAAKAALKTLLEGWAWTGGVPVIMWGPPTESEDIPPGLELIYFGDADASERDQTLGGTASKEFYNLRVVIDVRKEGDEEQATETRAWALYGHVTTLLDQNRTLSGTLVALQDRTFRQTNNFEPAKWWTRITIEQACIGHIQHP